MNAIFNSCIRAAGHPLGGAVCAVAVLLIASSAQAQNLFVANYLGDTIYEYTPGGAQSTFASGFVSPGGLAFNSAGNLFVADQGSGTIYEFTLTTFSPYCLATSSTIGARARHGPHQAAQKSIITGRSDFNTV